MATFAELGLHDELVRAASDTGYERPTALQAAALPVLRRGGNALVLGSAGAGITAAWGLALMDRVLSADAADAGETGQWPRVLVVTPTAERAAAAAEGLSVFGGSVGLSVRAALPGYGRDVAVDVLIVPATSLVRSLERSTLKLGRTIAIVVDATDALIELHGTDVLEALMVAAERDTQRVIVAAKATEPVTKLVDAHVRRAVTIPAAGGQPVETTGSIGYVVARETEKEEQTARLIGARGDAPGVVATRTGARAARIAERLARRGLDVRVISLEDAPAKSVAIAYDVPPDAELMATLEADAVVLVEPDELTHLRTIAAAAALEVRAAPERTPKGSVERFRDEVRRALDSADLDAQMLVLEPLFATRSAAEVAAALSALLRAKPAPEPAAPAAKSLPMRGAPTGEPPESFARLFVGVGERDNVRPGDIVGAITGEAGVKGDQIGRVEIRDTFSVVEVAPDIAERVIRALNGTTLRGRALRVDYDRRGTVGAPPARRERRPGPRPRR